MKVSWDPPRTNPEWLRKIKRTRSVTGSVGIKEFVYG
jgi:hypothetical protein